MNNRTALWLAWLLWAVFIVLGVGIPVLTYFNRSSQAWASVITALELTPFPTIGALVAGRRPRNPMGWLMLAITLSFAGSIFAYQYALYSLVTAPGALPAGLVFAWLSTWVGLPGSVLLLTFFFLLFPTGHLPSPRWRALAWLAGVVLVVSALSEAFTPTAGPTWVSAPFRNPLGIESLGPFLNGFHGVINLMGIPISAVCALSTLLRFRRARGDERQQLKWFAYAIVFLTLFYMLSLGSDLSPAWSQALQGPIGDIFFGLSISLPAVAIGLAILKYRLYDIDLLIRRTLIYGLLTAILALVYLVSVVALQALFTAVTGAARSELVTVLSTLAIAALFVPLRQRLQGFIDRRFYRGEYDSAKTLAQFSATLRDEVNLEDLTGRLVTVVDETMQPASVDLWLASHEH